MRNRRRETQSVSPTNDTFIGNHIIKANLDVENIVSSRMKEYWLPPASMVDKFKMYCLPITIILFAVATQIFYFQSFFSQVLKNPFSPGSNSTSPGSTLEYERFELILNAMARIKLWYGVITTVFWFGMASAISYIAYRRNDIQDFDRRIHLKNFDILYLLGTRWQFSKPNKTRKKREYSEHLLAVANKGSSNNLIHYFQAEQEKITKSHLLFPAYWNIHRKLLCALLDLYLRAIKYAGGWIHEHHRETIGDLFFSFRSPPHENTVSHTAAELEKILGSEVICSMNHILLRPAFQHFFTNEAGEKFFKAGCEIFLKMNPLRKAGILLPLLQGRDGNSYEIAQNLFWQSKMSNEERIRIMHNLLNRLDACKIGVWPNAHPNQIEIKRALSNLFLGIDNHHALTTSSLATAGAEETKPAEAASRVTSITDVSLFRNRRASANAPVAGRHTYAALPTEETSENTLRHAMRVRILSMLANTTDASIHIFDLLFSSDDRAVGFQVLRSFIEQNPIAFRSVLKTWIARIHSDDSVQPILTNLIKNIWENLTLSLAEQIFSETETDHIIKDFFYSGKMGDEILVDEAELQALKQSRLSAVAELPEFFRQPRFMNFESSLQPTV